MVDQYHWTPPASPDADPVAGASSGGQLVDVATAENEEERLQREHLEALQLAKSRGEERRQAEEAERITNEAAEEAARALAAMAASRAAETQSIPPRPTRDPPRPPEEPPSYVRVRKPERPKPQSSSPGEWKPVLLKPPTTPTTKARSSGTPVAEPNLTERFKEALDKGTVEIDEILGAFYTWMGDYRQGKGQSQQWSQLRTLDGVHIRVCVQSSGVSMCPCAESGR